MKRCWLAAFLVLLALPVSAQKPNLPTVRPGQGSGGMPTEALQLGPDERQFFDLGATLARGAFAYAALAKQAAPVAKTQDKLAQVRQLARLDPLAGQNRREARDELRRAETLMRGLHAPASALAPVSAAAVRLSGALPISGEARTLAFFSRPAARTVSALSEFEALSSLPEAPAVRAWLISSLPAGAAPGRSALAWYAEGEIAGLSQIAAAHEMPDLLPPAEQIATDLRGLRAWLTPRLPEVTSPEQAALRHDVNVFLEGAALAAPPGVKSSNRLTLAQLQALGSISRRVQVEVLGADGAETAARG